MADAAGCLQMVNDNRFQAADDPGDFLLLVLYPASRGRQNLPVQRVRRQAGVTQPSRSWSVCGRPEILTAFRSISLFSMPAALILFGGHGLVSELGYGQSVTDSLLFSMTNALRLPM